MNAPAGYIICGAPSTGKTALALRLAAILTERGETCHVLHTDLLRVTLRQLGMEGLESDTDATPAEQALAARLPLEVLWAKNRRERHVLIIEGALALGFQPSMSQTIALRGSRNARRVVRGDQPLNPEVMERAAQATAMARAVEAMSPPDSLRYDSTVPIATIGADIVRRRTILKQETDE